MIRRQSDSTVSTRIIVENVHANLNGVLFGGFLMCWIDEIAFICARRFSGNEFCATEAIDHISFREVVRVGEHLVLSASVVEAERSSMRIHVQIDREDPLGLNRTALNKASVVVGSFDQFGCPLSVPEFPRDRYSEVHRRFEDAEWFSGLRVCAPEELGSPNL